MSDYVDQQARDDFAKARIRELFTRLGNLFSPSKQELLSLGDVRAALHPKGETYRGLQTVPVQRIVGSEGRYQDFNRHFLPRHEYLRGRWESIDRAHLRDVVLPPIKLYEIGGFYFVRDGNHRVSVARMQGVLSVDAEVVSLETEIPFHEKLTKEGLRSAVIEHEKREFYKRLRFEEFVDRDLVFTATGRYDEIERHILGHKFFLNEQQMIEVPLGAAIESWYANVFRPIVDVIEWQHVMARFPKRTPDDLYLWIVRHWDQLKQQYGDVSVVDAVGDYSRRYGKGIWERIKGWFGAKEDSDPSKEP